MMMDISIHALLAESDFCVGFSSGANAISIHALLAESDARVNSMLTLIQNFYPRSPCGERPNLQRNQHQRKQISIHALLAESDSKSAQNSGAL